MTEFKTLALDLIVPSLTNPRKNFDAVRLTELANSIAASGVHQPVLVRPLPGTRMADTFVKNGKPLPTYELVAGERRYRACQQAGLASIPCLIRELSDEQVLEIQIIENLQRDDLSALEEAEGYAALIAQCGHSNAVLAGKIGKSASYVNARLKLLDLSVECQQALRSGAIDASRALLIARIPDTALQSKALAEATRKDYQGTQCSVRALQSWLQANVMLRLDRATFKIADARLLAEAGSCKVCPKRTGANPDLFSDVDNVDICTDPACFNAKTEAHRGQLRERAQAKGMRVIDGAEAKEIFRSQYTLAPDGYSTLSQLREDTTSGEPQTLAKLLGKDLPAPVLIENPYTKELIEAVPTDEAEAMLLARGLVKAFTGKSKSRDPAKDIESLKQEVRSATAKTARKAMHAALVQAVRQVPDKHSAALISPALLRAWAIETAYEIGSDQMADYLGITLREVKDPEENETQIRLHLQACTQGALYRLLAQYMIYEDQFSGISFGSKEIAPPAIFQALAQDLDVDLTTIEAEAAAEVRSRYAEELKNLKAQLKPEKTALVKPPAAPAALVTSKTLNPPAGMGKQKFQRLKAKLSAEEAQQGIASAMQDAEQTDTAWPAPKAATRVACKYRGPNGETWSGRGLKPRWVTHYVANGGQIEDLQVAA